MSKVHSTAEAAGVQLDKPVSLHPDNLSKCGDDRDGGHEEQLGDLQDLVDQYAGGVPDFETIQSLYKKSD